MTALSKAEISNSLTREFEISNKDASLAVDCFFDVLSGVLVEGQDVKISGFGNFVVKEKKARPGRNPKTGEPVVVSERRVVTFKSGIKLKKYVGSKS
ncbi:MAG: integration host factor subunit alpha [Gammaproteobacteria bacterium]|nr:integration host factor subunit alpha [Gammaproteobacteria bacterium]